MKKKNYNGDTEQGKFEIARDIIIREMDKPVLLDKPYHVDTNAVDKYDKCLGVLASLAKQGKLEFESDEASQPLSIHSITIQFIPTCEGLCGTEFKSMDLAIIFGLMEDAVLDMENGCIMLTSKLYKKGTQGK